MQCRCTGVGRRNPMALQAVSSQSHRPRDSNVASSSAIAGASSASPMLSPPPVTPHGCRTPSSACTSSALAVAPPVPLLLLPLLLFLLFFFLIFVALWRDAWVITAVVVPPGVSLCATAAAEAAAPVVLSLPVLFCRFLVVFPQ